MPTTADAVVIGSGAFGASTAYHLLRLGLRRVVLVERHALVSQTSPRAAGNSAQARPSEPLTQLAIASVEALQRFEEETGEPLVFHVGGSLGLVFDEQSEAAMRAVAEPAMRHGVPVEFISPAEARELFPLLDAEGTQAIMFTPTDPYFEPGDLPRAYLRAVERLGCTLLPHTAVTGILLDAGVVRGVATEQGEIHAPVVVDAAGAWARLLAEQAGCWLPTVPMRHQLLITEPIDGVVDGQPIVRYLAECVYLRPCDGGILLGGYEADPAVHDMRRHPADFQIRDLELDFAVLQRFLDIVSPRIPALRAPRVREHRGGLPTITPDGHPLVGPVPGADGLYMLSGCCVGGLSISPSLGALLAEWIVLGRPTLDIDLTCLRIERFGAPLPEEQLVDACIAEYRGAYGHVDQSVGG